MLCISALKGKDNTWAVSVNKANKDFFSHAETLARGAGMLYGGVGGAALPLNTLRYASKLNAV